MYFIKQVHYTLTSLSAAPAQRLTFLLQSRGQRLSLLEVWPREHAEDFLDAPPARPRQQLGQPHAEGRVAAVDIGDVRGVLLNNYGGEDCWYGDGALG